VSETQHRKDFELWFGRMLEDLYPNRDAGFVIVMTVFPLLERYLRQKLNLPPGTIHDPRLLGVGATSK
jgi:hypothetical protein